MTEPILNRLVEQEKFGKNVGKPIFSYMVGRRRVGKSTLLEHVCQKHAGFYHQAVEGTASQQIEHLTAEFKTYCPIFSQITPKTWSEFFSLLSKETLPPIIVFDEFPYWVSADPNLPSILQKWLDHELKHHQTLVMVSGSSQSMLHAEFLDGSAPLYGRAGFFMRLEPMAYSWFCKALHLNVGAPESFEKFAIVGGIPHYWKLLDKSPLPKQLDRLFFEPSAILAEEPRVILHDEGITGNLPKAILDLIGRGVAKPGEVASRLGLPQSHLSRPLAQLAELGLVYRDLPFGESLKTSKKVLYSIQDPALAFYYSTCVPHRHHWRLLSGKEKHQLVNLHVSRQFEIYCRKVFPAAQRYWEPGVEIDLVAPTGHGTFLAGECKWTTLTTKNQDSLRDDLKTRLNGSHLKIKNDISAWRIFSKNNLVELARMEDRLIS